MNPEELWAELKRRRVVRVAVAYAVTVFVVLQVADLTFEPLGLPDWSYRLLLLTALAGFPVAVALAWAFDVTPDGIRSDGDAAAQSTRRGGRWVVAASAVAAVAVGAWQFAGGADPVVAEGVDAELVAVMPFRVSSNDERVTILREGVIDMLAPIFSGTPRTVDSGAMVSAWRQYSGGDDADLSEGEAVELARRLGAGRAVVGSVVGSADAFAINARLLSVPGGEVVGVASVDGSSERLRETISQLAAQILSMEEGVDEGQIDYLSDVPLDALEAYLEGRRLYRQTRYIGARTAFSRALDADSTFALAALGAWEAVAMGLDADRAGLRERAIRLLNQHLSTLPPRDRVYAELLSLGAGPRSAVETVRESGARMVTALPDKAEAWYMYADQMYHRHWMVAEDDWEERAVEAFRRAEALDPGLQVVREHLFFVEGFALDTVGLRDRAEMVIATGGDGYSAAMARSHLAYSLGDPTAQAELERAIPTLSYPVAQVLPIVSSTPHTSMPRDVAEAIFDRMEAAAITDNDRRQALEFRSAFYRAEGFSTEADAALRRLEAAFGPQPEAWVLDYLYWNGPETPAVDAAADLAERVAAGPLPWRDGGSEACTLELWRLRHDDEGSVEQTIDRLRAASPDPDPAHGGNALCALGLEAMVAHRRGAADVDAVVAGLTAALDDGPPGGATAVSLELAWILEDRGDLAAAARVAGYMFRGTPFLFAESTRHLESARLWDAAGEAERAVERYHWYLAFRDMAGAGFQDEADVVRARVVALEAGR